MSCPAGARPITRSFLARKCPGFQSVNELVSRALYRKTACSAAGRGSRIYPAGCRVLKRPEIPTGSPSGTGSRAELSHHSSRRRSPGRKGDGTTENGLQNRFRPFRFRSQLDHPWHAVKYTGMFHRIMFT